MKKRIISMVLAIGMLVGAWDTAALAKETQTEKTMTAQAAYAQLNTSNMYSITNYGIKKQKKTDMLLKVPNNKNGRVNPMIISPADHSTGELFTLAKVGKWYTVTPKCAGSWRLNVEGEKSNTNTDVGLWTNTNHSTQGWYFEPVSGVTNGYIIRSANNTSCVLDVRGTTKGKGVKIKKYEANNPCQIWLVRTYTPSISLNKTSATLDIDSTVTLSASRRPVNMPVTYSSSSAKIATVNSKGIVTAKASGTATIYAKCCGKTATCTITVRKTSLRVDSKLAKTTITQGSMDGVSGTVSSSKKVTKVTAQIIGKSNKKVYYSKTVNPNKTSYNLTGDIDNAMKFDKLGKGTYIFRVTAEDETGNKASKDIECNVNEKPKAQTVAPTKTTATTSKKLDVKLYLQDDKKWNKVKIGKSTSTVGQVGKKTGYGCVLTSVAMIERYAQKNKSITPKTIATEKKEFNGDLFTWKGKKYGKKYTQLKSPGNLTNIYKQITAGKPVIVSVTKKGEGQHWVVIYGYESVKLDKNKKPTGLKYSNFLIRDPGWGNSRKKLSVYSKIKNAYARK